MRAIRRLPQSCARWSQPPLVAALSTLTHVDPATRLPRMVDVSAKSATTRTAVARSVIAFPADAFAVVYRDGVLASKKGPIDATAVVAGTMGAKKTSELIPFCHPIPLEGCSVRVRADAARHEVVVECEVRTTNKTGVEMEALVGVSVAALTIYDMCKAASHAIVIRETRLLSKDGGKSAFVSTE